MVTEPTWPVQEWVILMRKIWDKLGWTFILKGRFIMGTWVHRSLWYLLRTLARTPPESDLSWYQVFSCNVLHYFRSWPEVAHLACQCGNFTVRQHLPYRDHGSDIERHHVIQDIRVALMLNFEDLPHLEEPAQEQEQEQEEEEEEEEQEEEEPEQEEEELEHEYQQQQEQEETEQEEIEQQEPEQEEEQVEEEEQEQEQEEVCCYCFG